MFSTDLTQARIEYQKFVAGIEMQGWVMRLNATDSFALPEEKRVRQVWLNGVDITNVCRFIDTSAGEVECYVRDDKGNFKDDGKNLIVLSLRGRVSYRLGTSSQVYCDMPKCASCDGSGWLTLFTSKKPCPICNGIDFSLIGL